MAAHVVIPDVFFPTASIVPSTKSALRSRIRQQRQSLPESERQQQQSVIRERLMTLLKTHRPARTALYMACGSELDLAADASAWSEWTAVYVPVLTEQELRFGPARPPWALTSLGTREPAAAPTVPVTDLDLAVMPLLACDSRGTRLGQGGGWYDRTLDKPASSLPLCLGVGFDLQYVDQVPAEAHDRPLDIFLSACHLQAFTTRGQQWLTGS